MTVDLRASPEFQAYLRTREAVLQIKQRASDPQASRYWEEELGNIDYLIDASPLIVRKLRHHAFHITNLRPYDYREKEDGKRGNFEARLRALEALDRSGLRVPESPALGGFGYGINGAIYNVDTLKFYEVLIGMDRAGVLDRFRGNARRAVWEIGAGWGGFAYQFKTLFPTTSYVITDFPELFLFSATYLQSVFPDARVHFVGTGGNDDPVRWGEYDFVFVPNTETSIVSQARLDLAVNMVSFQEMTEAQVREYVRLAAAARCPVIYSLNRERSPFNTELTTVSGALDEHYVMREIAVLDTEYTSAMKKPPKAGKSAEPRSELGYRHMVGRLRPGRPEGRPLQELHAGRPEGRPVHAQSVVGADLEVGPSDPTAPRVVLGMTLYNKAHHLREALDSLLAQTEPNFLLVMLDDGSDESEAIAREYEARDTRVRYFKHERRRAMVATWREVVDIARRECPSAPYFAWVSDHDRWHPEWLRLLLAELEAHPQVVLAYPVTRRIGDTGVEFEKGARLFDTFGITNPVARWRHFCHHNVGSGDMVYGLMRLDALLAAGVFRPVLRPDRLLMAELSLQGQIKQVPEVLWFRRQADGASVERQGKTLFLEGEQPPYFSLPPWMQHAIVLRDAYIRSDTPPRRLPRGQMLRMIARYQLLYGWKHVRKTEASHSVIRGIDNAIWVKKIAKRTYHHAVYHTLVGGRAALGKARRMGRRIVYEALMLTHRMGLRSPRDEGARR